MQKLQAAAQASVEERKRLEQQYKDKIIAVERRVRELGDKEREYKRTAKHFVSPKGTSDRRHPELWGVCACCGMRPLKAEQHKLMVCYA
jgi:hypothetical protein